MAVIALLAVLAAHPPFGHVPRANNRTARLASRPQPAPAAFEFAPALGRGMDGICACSASVTSYRGMTMAFGRTGRATCSRAGLDLTGIQAGDMIACPTAVPLVMPGTRNGSLGLLMEKTATNTTLWSEDLSNAAWTLDNSGSASPSILTSDAIAGPIKSLDGGLAPELVQIGASDGGTWSRISQATACPNAAISAASFYFRPADGGTSTINVALTSTTPRCTTCTASGTDWTRCVASSVANTTNQILELGHLNATQGCAAVSQAADNVYITGFQCEASNGSYATSYVPTTSASATRNISTARISSPTTTNATIRSDALESWASGNGGGPGAIAVSINSTDILDPFGTNQAEKLVIPEVTGAGAYSFLYIGPFAATAANWVSSVYLATASGTASVYLSIWDGAAGYKTALCNVSTTWSRCSTGPQLLTAANRWLMLGVDLRDAAQSAKSAQTIYVIGAQSELGSTPTEYIRTTTAAAVALDIPSSDGRIQLDRLSFSVEGWPEWNGTTNATSALIGVPRISATEGTEINRSYVSGPNTPPSILCYSNGAYARDTSASHVPRTPNKLWCSMDYGATSPTGAWNNGVLTKGAGAPFRGSAAGINFGMYGAGNVQYDGVVTKFCVDPNPLRCR